MAIANLGLQKDGQLRHSLISDQARYRDHFGRIDQIGALGVQGEQLDKLSGCNLNFGVECASLCFLFIFAIDERKRLEVLLNDRKARQNDQTTADTIGRAEQRTGI